MPSYESGNYSLGYIDPSDTQSKDLKQMMDWFYQSNYTVNSTQWVQGAIDKRFKVGDQNLYNQVYGQNSQNVQKFFFNLIRRMINMICGFQRKNRKSIVTMPVNDNDDTLADDYNKVLRYCDDRDGFQEYLSQAFEGACDTGETLLHLYPDFTFDPISGDLFTDSVQYNNYLIDQYTRKQDLSDCNGIWRRKWTSKEVAKTLLPEYASEIDKMKPGGMKDGRFPMQAELQNVAINNLFTFDEFYYLTTREATIILDPMSGEAAEWEEDRTISKKENQEEMRYVLQQQPWLVVQKKQVPTNKLIIALNDKQIYHGPNHLGIDDYPFIPCQCYVEQDIQAYAWRKQGIIRGLRDAQFLYNMRKVIELQLLQSSLNAGWIYPVDAVPDPKCFRQSSGGDGFLIPLKAGRQPSEIQRIEPVAIPQSLLELSNSLAEDITRISGVNEELLGSATDDKSGILSMLRQGAGLTTLQTIFDKLDYSQRLYGKIRMQAIRKNFSKGKIRNILGHEADPRFFSSNSQKFSVAVEEGNYSTTQKQMELQQLLHFKQIGMPIPDSSIMRAAFITNKKQIIQEMQEMNQQQAEQTQAQSAMQEKSENAKIMKMFAESKVNMAREQDLKVSAMERMAKMQDLKADSEYKSAKADLEMVKTMIELEDLDLANLRANLELAEYIKMQNKNTQQMPLEAI
jgi:CRISPR/Cas system-associated endonuclease Cas3-HD